MKFTQIKEQDGQRRRQDVNIRTSVVLEEEDLFWGREVCQKSKQEESTSGVKC